MNTKVHTLALSLAQQLIQTDTVNPPGNESDAVRFLAPLFEEKGFVVKEYACGPNRSSLIAHKGRTDKPSLMLSGHLDTVPFGSQPWTNPPLSGSIVDQKLYGRGSADMKGGVAVICAASLHLASQIEDEPITVILSADEEVGCGGVQKLINEKVVPPARCILVAEPTGNIPCLGHKGVFWVKALFHGTTAHAAFPDLGDNALLKAAQAVVALNGNIVAGKSHPVMGDCTLVTSRFLSGDNYNSVPDLAEVGIDIRSTVNWTNNEILHSMEELLAPLKPDFSVLCDLSPLWTKPGISVVREVVGCCDAVRGMEHPPRIVTFYTDGGVLSPGLDNAPTIILGPGESGMAHKVDEFVELEDVHLGVDMYLEILNRLCCR